MAETDPTFDRLRRLDFSLLLIFRTVMTHRKLTRAAGELGLTQSALSHALKRLTDIIGEPLFERERYGVTPTETAYRLIGPVETIIATAEAALGLARPFDPATTTRTFRVIGDDRATALLAGVLVDALAGAAPSASLSITAPDDDPLAALADGSADLAILDTPPSSDGFQYGPIVHTTHVGLARKGDPILKKVSLKRLASSIFVGYGPLTHTVEMAFASAGRPITTRGTVQTAGDAMVLANRIGGYTIVPRPVAAERAKTHGLRPFDLPFDLPPIRLFAVTHDRRASDPAVELLLSVVEKAGTSA